jgi:hypothetical protein
MLFIYLIGKFMAATDTQEDHLSQATSAGNGIVAGVATFAGATEVASRMSEDTNVWQALAETAKDVIGKTGEGLKQAGEFVSNSAESLKNTAQTAQTAAQNINAETVANAANPDTVNKATELLGNIKDKAGQAVDAIKTHAGELEDEFIKLEKNAQRLILAGAVIVATVVTAVSLGHKHEQQAAAAPHIDTAKTEVVSKSTHAHAKGKEAEKLSFG